MRRPIACCSRCSRTKARARSSSTTRKRCGPRSRRASTMARLWDKGLPLDERILRFTAGEDHKLDERLVAYDARASIAHARMLEKQQLLSADDCKAICSGLEALTAAHAAGEWSIELKDEDVHS